MIYKRLYWVSRLFGLLRETIAHSANFGLSSRRLMMSRRRASR